MANMRGRSGKISAAQTDASFGVQDIAQDWLVQQAHLHRSLKPPQK
jgi:hypothetical protein